MVWIFTLISSLVVAAINPAEAFDLVELDQRLVDENIQLSRSRVQVDIIESNVEGAKSRLGPRVNLSVARSRTHSRQYGQATTFNGDEYSVTLTQPLFNSPLELEVDRLTISKDSALVASDLALAQQRLRLVENYTSWLQSSERKRLLELRFGYVEKRVSQIAELFDKRRVSITDFLTIKNEAAQTLVELAIVEASKKQAELEISILVRQLPELSIEPSIIYNKWPFEVGIGQDPIPTEHPAIVQARLKYNEAEIAKQQILESKHPKLIGQLSGNESNVTSNSTETFPRRTYSATLQLTWELYDSGENEIAARGAEHRIQDAQFVLEITQKEIGGLVERSSSDLATSQEGWLKALEEYSSAEKLVKAANKSFELGVGDIGNVLTALDRKIDSELRISSQWLAGFIAYARLLYARNLLDQSSIKDLALNTYKN